MAKVKVEKIDLDTIGAAYFLGVNSQDEIEILRGSASIEDLANPDVICIECGGSGQTQLNNWDHHEEGKTSDSAALQAFNAMVPSFIKNEERSSGVLLRKFFLAQYIHVLDTQGPNFFHERAKELQLSPPFLSDIISGMFLLTRDPKEKLLKGIEILSEVIEGGQDPASTISGFDSFYEAKKENDSQIASVVKEASWEETSSGLKIGYLQTHFYGALGALYSHGAQIGVVYNPNLNGVKKITIGGNGTKVSELLPFLEEVEDGWGGPATGTIIGSPKNGTRMTLQQVVQIVKATL